MIRDLGSSSGSGCRKSGFPKSDRSTFGIWYRWIPVAVMHARTTFNISLHEPCFLLYRHTQTMVLYLITRNPLPHPHRLILQVLCIMNVLAKLAVHIPSCHLKWQKGPTVDDTIRSASFNGYDSILYEPSYADGQKDRYFCYHLQPNGVPI